MSISYCEFLFTYVSKLFSQQVKEKEQAIYQLQQKVMLLDHQLHIAEERCRDNAAHLSEKDTENNKLQGALAQQTKVSMEICPTRGIALSSGNAVCHVDVFLFTYFK